MSRRNETPTARLFIAQGAGQFNAAKINRYGAKGLAGHFIEPAMLIRNSVLYMVARLLPGLFSLGTTAILTRLLEPREYGLYGLALVMMMLGSSIAFDWLGLSFLRFYQARREDPRLIVTFTTLFFGLTVLTAALLGAAFLSGVLSHDLRDIYLLGLIMMWAFSWFELASRVAVAEFQPLQYLKIDLARSVLIFVGAAAAAWLTHSAIWTAAAAAFGMIVGAFLGKMPVPRPSWRDFDRDLARDVMVFGIPLAASLALYSLIDGGTRLLLVHFNSVQALGIYTAASVLVMNTLGVMATGVSSAGYSLVVREVERGDHVAARRQLLANGTLLLAVIAPASLGIALTGTSIATTLVGSKFMSGVGPLMPWMAMSSFFGSLVTCHFDQAFQLGKRPHLKVWLAALYGMTVIGLSLRLIPGQGAIGVALALAAGSLVSCVSTMIVGRRVYPIPFPVAGAFRVGLCSIAMALVVIQCPDSGWAGLALRSGLGAAAYALAALAINLLDSRDHLMRFARWSLRSGAAFFTAAALKKLR